MSLQRHEPWPFKRPSLSTPVDAAAWRRWWTSWSILHYPAFRAAGLCTSTGVVESGCHVAIGPRCKRAGMHWTVAGADAIIALGGCKLNGRLEDLWKRRSAARAEVA